MKQLDPSIRRMHVNAEAGAPGVLLLSESLAAVAYNWEAVRILAFPTKLEYIEHIHRFLARSVRSRLASRRASDALRIQREFTSGVRRYTCRALDLCSTDGSTGDKGPSIALLLERQQSTVRFLKQQAWAKFNLTTRERQCVELLLQGMTNKAIAEDMKISPNTVKSHVQLIMTKLNVSTRSGITGKILFSQHDRRKIAQSGAED